MELVVELLAAMSSLAVLVVSVYVYLWTKRRDSLEVLRYSWQEAQGINLAALSDPSVAAIMEKVIYGDKVELGEQVVADYFLFLYLNRIRHDYVAFTGGLIGYKEYVAASEGTLRLIVASKERVRFLLLERGYSRDYLREIMDRLDSGKILPPRKMGELQKNFMKSLGA